MEIGHSNEIYWGNTTPGSGQQAADTDIDIFDGTPGRASIGVGSQSTSNTRRDALRVRSVNMSVVWIMRVE